MPATRPRARSGQPGARPRPTEYVPTPGGQVGAHLETPSRPGPWPGVVVIHDAAGLTGDTARQCRWLADEGFLAVAPDLFEGGSITRCLRSVVRDYTSWQGEVFAQVEAVRAWLAQRPGCTGRVGVVGFCLGGGFALSLAPRGGFQAASVNYGILPKDAERALQGSCPIVGSYGGRDRSLRGAGPALDAALEAAGVAHRVDVYPHAGHGFLNDHGPGEVPFLFQLTAPVLPTGYHGPSARIARERITAFLRTHLAGPVEGIGAPAAGARDANGAAPLPPAAGSSADPSREPTAEVQPPAGDSPSV